MSRGGNVLPSRLVEEHAEAQKTRAKHPVPSETYQSSGSVPSPVHGFKSQSIASPGPSSREKHMPFESLRTHHRFNSSKASEEWSFVPIVPKPHHQKTQSNQSVPISPSKKHAISRGTGTGELMSPKLPFAPGTLPQASTIPARHRPSPISTDVPINGSRIIAERSRHTPNSSSSSSQSSFSSSSQDLKTPTTPSRKKDRFPKIFDFSSRGGMNDADEDFTIVLNEEEAIHWTKQTSDLRQPSPTRPSWTGQQTPDSYPSPQSKLRLPTKLPSSFRSTTQSPASPVKPDSRRTK